METLPEIGQRFRELREAAGKTQSQIASAAGMRREALSRFECGRGTDFSLVKLLRILTVLDAELNFVSVTRRPTLEKILEERLRNPNVGPNLR